MLPGKIIAFSLLGLLLGAASVFFTYYTVRLAYVNIAMPGAASHRQSGMLIGAAIFPLAAFGFGWLALHCAEIVRRAGRR